MQGRQNNAYANPILIREKIMKKLVPWWAKIILKIILAKLPISYKVWAKIGIFRHGKMDQIDYSIRVFRKHLEINGLQFESLSGLKVLEIGPGDSLATAILTSNYGGSSILVDAADYASKDVNKYNKIYRSISSKGVGDEYSDINDFFEKTKSKYLTSGLESLKCIPSNSVDFIFSQAVLEHIKLSEFVEVQKQIFRILKVGATGSHRIDLKDHLGGGLSNLILPKNIWETDIFYDSGFYTNRLRFEQIIEILINVGFSVEVVEKDIWEHLPIPAKKMSSPFRSYTFENLRCSGFTVLLKKS